jgi:hypothetical protein
MARPVLQESLSRFTDPELFLSHQPLDITVVFAFLQFVLCFNQLRMTGDASQI